jgi:hypothetical protein
MVSKAHNGEHCAYVADLIRAVFERDLVFSFICGSRASARICDASDVDFVAVLSDGPAERGGIDAEKEFYRRFVQYHVAHSLCHEHCGELLRRCTLDHLFGSGRRHLERDPEILESICYRTSCAFSEFRKARVVLGMFAGPKLFVSGDLNALDEYTRLANDYFALESELTRSVVRYSGSPDDSCDIDVAGRADRIRSLITAGTYADTPVGVRLDRWFNAGLARPKASHPAYAALVEQCCILETHKTGAREGAHR